MTNQHYKNGANFERRVKARLEEEGWTVWRTAGSHSKADLICVRRRTFLNTLTGLPYDGHRELMLVQCKSGTTSMSKKAKQEFYEFAAGLGAEAWLAERGMKFSRLGP